MHSPFPYESFALGQSFFGRENELRQLGKIANSSNNMLIHSKRRMGKTSLTLQFFETLKDMQSIYIDIFDITSPEDFARLLLKSIAQKQQGDIKTVISKLSNLFSRIRFGVEVDPQTGSIEYLPKIKELSFEEAIDEAFIGLRQMQKSSKIILAIDEFQQISLFKEKKIDALLRKYIQENLNISYLFLGSKRHILFELFAYKSPLYEMATQMELGPIALEDYEMYLQKHLDISKDLIKYLYDLTSQETKLMQHVCHILYRDSNQNPISKENIDVAIKEVVLSKDSSYGVLFDRLTLNKKKAFKILCLYDSNYFRKEVLNRFDITRQSLVSALNGLLNDEIIDKDNGEWFIPDRALELWGKYRF